MAEGRGGRAVGFKGGNELMSMGGITPRNGSQRVGPGGPVGPVGRRRVPGGTPQTQTTMPQSKLRTGLRGLWQGSPGVSIQE